MLVHPLNSLVVFILVPHAVSFIDQTNVRVSNSHRFAAIAQPCSEASPPGRPTPRFFSFLFDDTFQLLNSKTMGTYQVSRKRQFGPVYKSNIFFRPAVFATDEASMADLSAEESRKNLDAFFPPHHKKLFGPQSLLVQSGEQHARLRRLIQPTLSPAAVKSYQQVIDSSVAKFLQDLSRKCASEYVPVVPELRSFFISLVVQILLGDDALDNNKLVADLSLWSKGLLAPPLNFMPWSTAARAMRARKRIASRLETIIENKSTYGLLGRLVSYRDENGDKLSTGDVIDNVLTLISAGSDTTASAVTSLIMILSPEIKETIKAEPEKMLALLDKVLRVYPPAPFQVRLNKDEPLHVGGYLIPPNWLVVYGYAGALFSESTEWTDLKDNASPSSSLAFGGGPRMCPGRWLASTVLMAYCRELVNLEWKLDPNQNLEQRYTPGLFPMDGLRLKFTLQ
ncbi:hypothetical protein ACHAXA_005369 [Cyclostephanos tholiformis]|uniref:Cytochrome P450 n=1 Tax=Cyclostephanos tholiformis TaxID=382380 RepID=A0ABD3RDI3_9STRA